MILDEDDDPITACKVIAWVTVPHGSWLASSVFRVTQASLQGTAPDSTRVFKLLLDFNKRLCHIIPTDKMDMTMTMTMTMTHSEKSNICQMKAWPYRQECRGHDPTKKNLLCC